MFAGLHAKQEETLWRKGMGPKPRTTREGSPPAGYFASDFCSKERK